MNDCECMYVCECMAVRLCDCLRMCKGKRVFGRFGDEGSSSGSKLRELRGFQHPTPHPAMLNYVFPIQIRLQLYTGHFPMDINSPLNNV